MTTISVEELNQLLFLSFRYALGRRTYVVSDVVRYIMKNKELLTDNTIKRICSEIDETDKKNLGDHCDVSMWLQCSADLKQYISNKTNCFNCES